MQHTPKSPPKRNSKQPPFEGVHAFVRSIPRRKVATYAQVAAWLGNRISPLAVSWALSRARRSPKADVPWQRVVNGDGTVAADTDGYSQRALLEKEGIRFDDDGVIDLERYRWVPTRRR